MNKNFFAISFYALLAFCVLSYASVIYSLFQSVGEPNIKPVANIGFPFSYYYQFWLSGSDSPNCGWNLQNFVLDAGVIWLLTGVIFIIFKRKNVGLNNHEHHTRT